jgi:hypothetical protein
MANEASPELVQRLREALECAEVAEPRDALGVVLAALNEAYKSFLASKYPPLTTEIAHAGAAVGTRRALIEQDDSEEDEEGDQDEGDLDDDEAREVDPELVKRSLCKAPLAPATITAVLAELLNFADRGSIEDFWLERIFATDGLSLAGANAARRLSAPGLRLAIGRLP